MSDYQKEDVEQLIQRAKKALYLLRDYESRALLPGSASIKSLDDFIYPLEAAICKLEGIEPTMKRPRGWWES